MPLFDEEAPKKPATHAVGEDLSRLSVGELQERIELLQAEIARIGTALAAKKASRDAAQTFFKG